MKIPPTEAELFHADGRTDTTKLIVAFRNFANAPKNHNAPNRRQDYWHTVCSVSSCQRSFSDDCVIMAMRCCALN